MYKMCFLTIYYCFTRVFCKIVNSRTSPVIFTLVFSAAFVAFGFISGGILPPIFLILALSQSFIFVFHLFCKPFKTCKLIDRSVHL